MDEARIARWQALGTTVIVAVTRLEELGPASRIVRGVLASIDRSCSRFREDSEISAVNRAQGAPVAVSSEFVRAAICALRAARITDGDLDPTIGRSMRAAGYDRDFAAIRAGAPVRFTRAAGWRCVQLDVASATIRLPPGVEFDFGATAKALAADLRGGARRGAPARGRARQRRRRSGDRRRRRPPTAGRFASPTTTPRTPTRRGTDRRAALRRPGHLEHDRPSLAPGPGERAPHPRSGDRRARRRAAGGPSASPRPRCVDANIASHDRDHPRRAARPRGSRPPDCRRGSSPPTAR